MPTMTIFVQSVTAKVDRRGATYLDLVVRYSDKGDLRTAVGKIWSNVLYLHEQPQPGHVLDVEAQIEEWPPGSGKKQLNISDYRASQTPAEEFEMPSAVDAEEVYQRLYCRRWEDPQLQVLFDGITNAMENPNRGRDGKTLKEILLEIPAGVSMHHARRSGLLEHVAEMANTAASLYEAPVDWRYEILLAGILLHDLGKCWEYSPTTFQWDATAVGERFGHTCWLPTFVAAIVGHAAFDSPISDVIHCVLSHHGAQGGAPVVPKTQEAIILHHIDSMSAELDVCREAQRAVDRGDKPVFSQMLKATPICRPAPEKAPPMPDDNVAWAADPAEDAVPF